MPWAAPAPGAGAGYTLTVRRRYWDALMTLAGILLIYVAAVDETLFQAITRGSLESRAVVAVATVVAAAVPMLYALAALKQGPLKQLEALAELERAMRSRAFWILGGLLFLALAGLSYMQVGNLSDLIAAEGVKRLLGIIADVYSGLVFLAYRPTGAWRRA